MTKDKWIRREGIITIAFILVTTLNFFRIDMASNSVSDTLRPWVIQTVLLTFIFILTDYIIRGIKK